MASIRLTKDEIKEVTGTPVKRRQAEILSVLQIPFKIRPDGSILISRLAYEKAMGGETETTMAKVPGPNFDTLRNASKETQPGK